MTTWILLGRARLRRVRRFFLVQFQPDACGGSGDALCRIRPEDALAPSGYRRGALSASLNFSDLSSGGV